MILVLVGKSNGKTTTAMNVGTALAQRPVSRRSRRLRKVRLLNADPQATAVEWAAQRDIPPLIEVREHISHTIHQDLPELMDGVDDLLIDCPAGTGRPSTMVDGRIRITRSAILAAICEDNGLVIVPVGASGLDMWAGDHLMAVIEEAWEFPGAAPGARSRAAVLLNRIATPRGGRISQVERATRTRLESAPLSRLNTVIHDRTDFVKAPIVGLGITEFAPHSVASEEVDALTTELLTLAGENK
ncbi:hypothetical protein [Nocardia fluminea]|uniref:hypothetical protein n=1 Tax=Nocardia fluminea TaxID=134984 RepID=UPI00365C2919